MKRLLPSPRVQRGVYWLIPALLYLWGLSQAPRVNGPDLVPRPDALEYALLADRLAHAQPPLIGIGPHDYPSRYPLSYPLLLVPFDWIFRGDTTRLFWAAGVFGLLATVLMALMGARLAGSRLAGTLAASLWALHPQTIWAASINMSETAIVMMFCLMLWLALPWLGQPGPASGKSTGALRAAGLGLTLGWLTIAKAPFAWWALGLTLLVAGRARRERRWGPAAALVAAGLACALGDALYRRWAFGHWMTNGYQYWFPDVYDQFTRTFNWRYLFQPWDGAAGRGNLALYGRMAAGLTHDFYASYLAVTALAAAACLAWPGRRGWPAAAAIAMLSGWAAVGALFLGTYFFQSERFLLLWIPVVDLLVGWGLANAWTWSRLRRGSLRRWGAPRWAQGLGLVVAVLLVRGEVRRVAGIQGASPQHLVAPISARMHAMLTRVPEGAWLFTNYELPLVESYRTTPGPTGDLYLHYDVDRWYNGMVYWIIINGLEPHAERRNVARWYGDAPAAWRAGQPVLIGIDGAWTLDEIAMRRLFARPGWMIVYLPDEFPIVRQYFEQTIRPKLGERLQINPEQVTSEITLYQLTLKPAAADDRPTSGATPRTHAGPNDTRSTPQP